MTKATFLSVRFSIMQLDDITLTQKLVLGRIGSMKKYYESKEACAEKLNVSPITVARAKQALEKKGYIYCIADSGRGKTYLARPEFRIRDFYKDEREPAPLAVQKKLGLADAEKEVVKQEKKARHSQPELEDENTPSDFIGADGEPIEPPTSAGDVEGWKRVLEGLSGRSIEEIREDIQNEATKTVAEATAPIPSVVVTPSKPTKRGKRKNEFTEWKKKYSRFLPVLDMITNYLKRVEIPVYDKKQLRSDIVTFFETHEEWDTEEFRERCIRTYIEFLEGEWYARQLKRAQYCPRINSQNDFFRKFQAIRDFKYDKRRHYDPSKVLTPE